MDHSNNEYAYNQYGGAGGGWHPGPDMGQMMMTPQQLAMMGYAPTQGYPPRGYEGYNSLAGGISMTMPSNMGGQASNMGGQTSMGMQPNMNHNIPTMNPNMPYIQPVMSSYSGTIAAPFYQLVPTSSTVPPPLFADCSNGNGCHTQSLSLDEAKEDIETFSITQIPRRNMTQRDDVVFRTIFQVFFTIYRRHAADSSCCREWFTFQVNKMAQIMAER